MEEVCASRTLGYEYGFGRISQYAAEGDSETGLDGSKMYHVYTRSGTYDVKSIMHYDSDTGAGGYRDTMRKWKKVYSRDDPPPEEATEDNSELIPINVVPSALDLQAVKQLYSWN